MKKTITQATLVAVFSLFALQAFSTNINPGNSDPTYKVNNVFFLDDTGSTLFVDFAPIGENLVSLNILRDRKIMMTDDLTGLSPNSIYELNLSIMRSGQYTIELVTDKGISIQKNIVID